MFNRKLKKNTKRFLLNNNYKKYSLFLYQEKNLQRLKKKVNFLSKKTFMFSKHNSLYETKKYLSSKKTLHLFKFLKFSQNYLFFKREKYYFYKINIKSYINLLYFNQLSYSSIIKTNKEKDLIDYLSLKDSNMTHFYFYNKIESYFINKMMKKGYKHKALKNFVFLLEYIKNEQKNNPYFLFFEAIENITPSFLPKRRRKISQFSKAKRSIRWIFEEIKSSLKDKSIKNNKKFFVKIAEEIFKAYDKKGILFQKKSEMDLLAFAKYSFSRKKKKKVEKNRILLNEYS